MGRHRVCGRAQSRPLLASADRSRSMVVCRLITSLEGAAEGDQRRRTVGWNVHGDGSFGSVVRASWDRVAGWDHDLGFAEQHFKFFLYFNLSSCLTWFVHNSALCWQLSRVLAKMHSAQWGDSLGGSEHAGDLASHVQQAHGCANEPHIGDRAGVVRRPCQQPRGLCPLVVQIQTELLRLSPASFQVGGTAE